MRPSSHSQVSMVCDDALVHIWGQGICNQDDSLRVSSSTSLLSGVPDYFGRNKISSGGDLSHYSSASLY